MKMISKVLLPIIITLLIVGCNENEIINNNQTSDNINEPQTIDNIFQEKNIENEEENNVENIKLLVNNRTLEVTLEDNSSTKALVEKLKESDITINATEYGGFEKVGSLGFTLPREDTNIKTSAGDIVLYNGNQISLFYNSNSWSYTRLGKVTNIKNDELKNILGNGDVTIRFTLSE